MRFRFRPSLVREAMEVGKDVFPILGEVLVNTTLGFCPKLPIRLISPVAHSA